MSNEAPVQMMTGAFLRFCSVRKFSNTEISTRSNAFAHPRSNDLELSVSPECRNRMMRRVSEHDGETY